ncbi:MAG TPA: monovalent cation/H(+) antiporter subunit G [Syntrophomonadaceae bacterium]|nr:monovalent cation/H(+) antiporter subunit G [Syntrophomonadaceae bacterium]
MIKGIATICFIGSFLAFGLGTLGLFRFPDPYTRMHGVGIGDTLGVGLMGLGLLIISPNWILRIKLIIALLLFWVINPTMTHLIAKAAVIHGTKPVKDTKLGEE